MHLEYALEVASRLTRRLTQLSKDNGLPDNLEECRLDAYVLKDLLTGERKRLRRHAKKTKKSPR